MLDTTEVEHCGKPVHCRDDLPTHFPLWQLGRVTDDGRHAYSTLEKAPLLPDPLASGPTAARAIKMPLGITTPMIVHSDSIVGFLRVAVVTHENDDRVFAQAQCLQFVDNLADIVIGRADNGRVGAPCRVGNVLVHRLKPLERLLWIMRNVKRHIE